MSDTDNTVNANVDTNDKPKTKRAKTQKFSVNVLATKLGKTRGISVDRAAKDVRRIMRANFTTVCKLDANIAKVKTAGNDGNHWPEVNAKVAAFVLDPKNRKRQ